MKEIICDLCIWILRTLKVSVIINFKCVGKIYPRSNTYNFYYDCIFDECIVMDSNGDVLEFPHMKPFKFKTLKK